MKIGYKEQIQPSSELRQNIKNLELDTVVIRYITLYSKLVNVSEFKRKKPQYNWKGFVLTLDFPKGKMAELAKEFQLLDYSLTVEKYIDKVNQSFSTIFPAYLEVIKKSNFPIIFFLPPKIMSHPYANVTRYEFYYLLKPENIEVLKRTTFVLGYWQ